MSLGLRWIRKLHSDQKSRWHGLDEGEYQISQEHDAATALIVDGQLAAAAAEEHFNRKKHSGDFPTALFDIACRQPAFKPQRRRQDHPRL